MNVKHSSFLTFITFSFLVLFHDEYISSNYAVGLSGIQLTCFLFIALCYVQVGWMDRDVMGLYGFGWISGWGEVYGIRC